MLPKDVSWPKEIPKYTQDQILNLMEISASWEMLIVEFWSREGYFPDLQWSREPESLREKFNRKLIEVVPKVRVTMNNIDRLGRDYYFPSFCLCLNVSGVGNRIVSHIFSEMERRNFPRALHAEYEACLYSILKLKKDPEMIKFAKLTTLLNQAKNEAVAPSKRKRVLDQIDTITHEMPAPSQSYEEARKKSLAAFKDYAAAQIENQRIIDSWKDEFEASTKRLREEQNIEVKGYSLEKDEEYVPQEDELIYDAEEFLNSDGDDDAADYNISSGDEILIANDESDEDVEWVTTATPSIGANFQERLEESLGISLRAVDQPPGEDKGLT
jgi:hypothetical protein